MYQAITIESFKGRISLETNSSQVTLKYIELAADILAKPMAKDTTDAPLREWAVKVVDHYSPVKMSETTRNSLESNGLTTEVLMNLGITALQKAQYQRAIEVLEEAMGEATARGNLVQQAQILNNLGAAYFAVGQYDRAENYFQRSLELFRKVGR